MLAEDVPNPCNGRTHLVLQKIFRKDIARVGIPLLADSCIEVDSWIPAIRLYCTFGVTHDEPIHKKVTIVCTFQVHRILKTKAEVCGFVVSAKHRNDVLLKSPIFSTKSWDFDRNTSRTKPDLIDYAVYNCGSAQLRLFETISVPDKTVFYFVNMCTVDENSIGWLEEEGFIQEYSPPFNVVSCSSCNLKGHNSRSVTCPRKVAVLISRCTYLRTSNFRGHPFIQLTHSAVIV